MVSVGMSGDADVHPSDPAVLKALIASLQAENARMSAALQAHDQLVQALRLRIAKLQKQAFGKSSEKIQREIAQLELALEDLLIATAEQQDEPPEEEDAEPPATDPGTAEVRPVAGRGCRTRHHLNAVSLIPAPAVPIAGVVSVWSARM